MFLLIALVLVRSICDHFAYVKIVFVEEYQHNAPCLFCFSFEHKISPCDRSVTYNGESFRDRTSGLGRVRALNYSNFVLSQ